MFLGAGKVRQGYTRRLFQKKVFESNSGLVLHDTLIFKRSSSKYYRLQLYIMLADDSIYFRDLTFPINKQTKSGLSTLKTFEFCKSCFSLDDIADIIFDGTIRLNADPIMEFKKIKSNYFTSRNNITKESLTDMPAMPVSLCWLINTGRMF